MTTTISPAVVADPVAADRSADRLRLGSFAAEPPRVGVGPAASSVSGAGLVGGLRLALRVLGGFGGMRASAYAFPVAILAVGIPVALFGRMMWIARAL